MIPLVMSVIAKTETFQRNMAKAGKSVKTFSTTSSRTTAAITKLGRSMLLMAGVGGGLYMLQRGLRGAVTEASRAQEVMGKFSVVFGNNAREASRWAEEFGNSVGRSTTDIQEWMASVQDLFVPLGFAREEATGLSEGLVQLAVDVASFSNKVDADVIRDFTSALVGNHETVRKYGIIISENAIKQEALNQGLNKTYKELTDLEKVSLRMNLIQKGSTDAQGDAIRTSDNYANQVKRLNANYQELSVTVGEQLIPLLSDLLVQMNAFAENGNFAASMHERMASVFDFADSLTNLDELFKAFSSSPKWENTFKELADAHRLLAEVERAESSLKNLQSQIPQVTKRSTGIDWTGGNWKPAGLEPAAAAPAGMTVDAMKAELDMVREHIASIRSLDTMTRMEKIRNLQTFQAAHADTLSQVEEAEKRLNDEILSLQSSRVDALAVYNAELREDMESSALYAKEKFAGAAQEIEGSMSSAFQSMIQGGANFRDAMNQFFMDIGASFAKMAADMAARAAMSAILNAVVGGLAGGFNPAVQTGAPNFSPNLSTTGPTNAGVPPVLHSGWVPPGVPSFRNGRGLGSNEMVAVIEKNELLAPDNKIVKGGGAANFEPRFNIIIVRDEKAAQIEAMNSKDGEKSYIRHASRNPNI